MPTGYTYAVATGEVTEFKDYARRCARAFGASIEMRDAPADAEIPEKIEPQTEYHEKGMAGARQRLKFLRNASDAEIEAATRDANQEARDAHEKRLSEQRATENRYRTMLAKVEAWEPPTADHTQLKSFMVEQLHTTIDADGSSRAEEPEDLSPDEWKANAIADAEWSLSYHTEERRKEIERAATRNTWLSDLRRSLDDEDASVVGDGTEDQQPTDMTNTSGE